MMIKSVDSNHSDTKYCRSKSCFSLAFRMLSTSYHQMMDTNSKYESKIGRVLPLLDLMHHNNTNNRVVKLLFGTKLKALSTVSQQGRVHYCTDRLVHQTESSSLGGGCGPGSGICHVMKCHTRHQSNRSCTMAVPVVVLLAINSGMISVIMMA